MTAISFLDFPKLTPNYSLPIDQINLFFSEKSVKVEIDHFGNFRQPKIFRGRKITKKNLKTANFCHFLSWRPNICQPLAQWYFFMYKQSREVVVELAQNISLPKKRRKIGNFEFQKNKRALLFFAAYGICKKNYSFSRVVFLFFSDQNCQLFLFKNK